MIIVKRKAEVIKFGAFVLIMALMAYYVAGKMEVWRASRIREMTEVPATSPTETAARAASPSDGHQAASTVLLRPEQPGEGSDFFAQFRMSRDRNRGALRETLREVMESESADADTRKQASQQYLQLGRVASLEDRAESLVRAKGFDDVLVNLVEGTAQVVVRSRSLTQPQFLQVVEMVSRITGVQPAAVQVIAREK